VIGRLIHRYRRWIPYLLLLPGLLWLFLFFVVPGIPMFLYSLSEGRAFSPTFQQPPEVWAWSNYPDAVTRYADNFRNSIAYGGLATIFTILIGYPLAYAIAFRGGRYKSLLLFIVIAPFFTSFLIRTISWKIILGNDGPFLGIVRDTLGLVPANFSILGTPLAVVAGLTYEFLPFMVLPLYVSLEKVDHRLIEAARDLYAGPWRPRGTMIGGILGALLGAAIVVGLGYADVVGADQNLALIGLGAAICGAIGTLVAHLLVTEAFVRVTFPLSIPGVFAGSLLVLIPAVGDYVNAELLGSPKTLMIGNVIQGRFLNQNDYGTASALAFILMSAILIAIFIYARVLGTEELSAGAV
jgi:spermidine/putrescine transport system permease protein